MADETRLDVVNEVNQASRQKHSWIVEIKDKLNNMESIPEKKRPKKRGNNIFRLPPHIRRNFNRRDYEPHIVSFGPYHHGHDHDTYKQTEQIKEGVVLHSLKRTNKTIYDYVNALSGVVQDLKDAYDELDLKWQQDIDAFLKLMVYDGCFLLEIVKEARDWFEANHRRVKNNDFDYGNPIWDIDGIGPRELLEFYKHDMLLLENQIPMLVLEKLAVVQMDKSIEEAQEYLQGHILEFIYPSIRIIPRKRGCLHVLDLYRHSLVSEELRGISKSLILFEKELSSCHIHHHRAKWRKRWRRISALLFLPLILVTVLVFLTYLLIKYLKERLFQTRLPSDFHFSIPSATEVDKAGIGFTMSKTKSLMDISFGRRNLRLPQIYVDEANKSRFLNIVAFEQVHEDTKNIVSSYIYFMSRLLQSADDVRLLQSCGIIHSMLHNEEVAEWFDSLSKVNILHDLADTFLDSKYDYVVKCLTKSFYYKMNNPWQKEISQNYLRSPLAIVSFIAAFLLFSLSAIQTVYTVLSYYSHK